MTHRRHRRRRPGLTLIEVMCASAILLLSLVAIGRLVDVGADRAADAADQTTATRLALSKLAEAEAGAVDPAAGGSGTVDDEPGWSWAVESAAAGVPNCYAVTARAWREANGRRVEVAVATMVLDPKATGTAAAAVPGAAP